MPIVPTGAPVWLRTNDFQVYGGDPNKRNYMGQGAIDPTSDVTAEQFSRLVEDVAELGRVTEFATITFRCNDTVPGPPTILAYNGLAGAAPTGSRIGNGHVSFAWPVEPEDAYGVEAFVNFMSAMGGPQGTPGGVYTEFLDSNADGLNERVNMLVFDASAAAIVDGVATVTVWTSVV